MPPDLIQQAHGLTDGPPELNAEERRTVVEAACEGIEIEMIVEGLLMQRHPEFFRMSREPPDWEAELMARLDIEAAVKGLWARHRANVFAEFNGFPVHVRRAMGNDPERWWDLRGGFCAAGYERPAAIIDDIEPEGTTLLFGRRVQQGMHRELARRIADLETGMPPEVQIAMRRAIGDQVRDILGFQPRRIAGSDQLSHHAFGLAIDVDAVTNPHIKNKEVLAVLKEVTKGSQSAPDGFDFGQRFIEPPKEGQETEVDYVALHAKAREASEVVRVWLEKAYGRRAQLRAGADLSRENIKRFEVELSKAKKTNAPASQIAEIEAKIKAARDELKEWQQAESDDADLAKLKILERYHGKDVRSWAAYGIVTVPLELVVALQRVGLTWGMQWKASKDVMHLELPLDLIDKKTGEVKARELTPAPGPIVVPPH